MKANISSSDVNKEAILKAMSLADKLLRIAEQGFFNCEDERCMQVYGTIRDCGYKIRKTAEQEMIAVQ